MIYKTRPQRPHTRTSKHGNPFRAGHGMEPRTSPPPKLVVRPPSEVIVREASTGQIGRVRTFHIGSTALNGKRSVRDLRIQVRSPEEVLGRQRICLCAHKGGMMKGVPRRTGHRLPKFLGKRRRRFEL